MTPDVGGFERLQNGRRCHGHGARTKILKKQTCVLRVTIFDGGGNAGSDSAASFIGDERNVLARTDAETSFHGVSSAGHQLWFWEAKVHLFILPILRQLARCLSCAKLLESKPGVFKNPEE